MNGLQDDIRRLAITCVLALASGKLCLLLGVPAPYLMGSLFGVWLSGGLVRPLRRHLGVPRWFHIPVVLGLGVLIGATFTPQFFAQTQKWTFTLAAMIATTLLGGQAEALALARDMVDRDYVVALFHLVRVVIVFVSTPLLLAFIEGSSAVQNSNAALLAMPGLFDLAPTQIAAFVGLGVGGYLGGRLVRLPMPHLLGPVFASTICHIFGWVVLPRIGEFVILAQIAIGGGVGARLAQVDVSELLGYLRDACASTAIILAAYLAAASGITVAANNDFLPIWLAFVPGGLYEVTLLLPWLTLRMGDDAEDAKVKAKPRDGPRPKD